MILPDVPCGRPGCRNRASRFWDLRDVASLVLAERPDGQATCFLHRPSYPSGVSGLWEWREVPYAEWLARSVMES